jgi:hypothetical protein
MKYALLAVLAICCVAGGCSSAVEGSTQTIAIESVPEEGAHCTVSNAGGEWSVVTPGAVIVKRSSRALHVLCTKAGYRDANEYVTAGMDNMAMIGAMVPYVGIVSAAVDGSSGTGGKYPDTYTIKMKPLSGPVPSVSAAPAATPTPTNVSTTPTATAPTAPRT